MYLDLAIRNLARTKTRTVLAIVGIVIGVVAIATIGIFGNSMQQSIMEGFEEFSNEVIISANPREGYEYIEESDITRIKTFPYAEEVIPIKQDNIRFEYKKEATRVTLYGINEEDLQGFFELNKGDIKLKGGCVIGYTLAEDLDLRIGSKISIDSSQFRVTGILKEEGRRFDISPDSAIFLSAEDGFNQISDDEGYSEVIVKVDSMEHVDAFEETLTNTINSRGEKVRVFKIESMVSTVEETTSTMANFLMAIAAISLLVAGVSILNIMLISTVERTREIGVMRAIGAHRYSVLTIFMTETLILGVLGGVVGSGLSFLGGYIVDLQMLGSAEYLFDISTLYYILQGFAVGIGVSVVAGIYPAWVASRLEPIEALRYE